MEMQVGRFREMMELLKPAVARKPTIKTLGSILIKDGKAVATNLEIMLITAIPEAGKMKTLIPVTEVEKVLKFVPGREMLQVESKAKKLSLSWRGGKASFELESPSNFPEIPEFVPETEASLDLDALIPALVAIQPYAATEDTRPVLHGTTLLLKDPIVVCAGDGFRMADKELSLSFPKEYTTVIPFGVVAVLKHLWAKTPRTPPASDELIPVIMAKKHAMVAHDGKTGLRFQFNSSTTAIVKLVDGNPPDFLKLVPKEAPVLRVHALATEIELAARRLMGTALDEKGIVRMVFEEDTMTLSAKKDGQEVESTVRTMQNMGTPNRFAVNVSYLLQYLSGKQGLITIEWTGGTSPIVFRTKNEPRVIIMPMMATWEDKEAKEAKEGQEDK